MMACNALKEVNYILEELCDGGEVNILCCGYEKCIGRLCICCLDTQSDSIHCIWMYRFFFFFNHFEKEELYLMRRKGNLKEGCKL